MTPPKDPVKYAEYCKEISEISKKRWETAEARERLSAAMKGKTPWNKGIPRTDEEKKKISEGHKGKHPSEETRKKLSAVLRERLSDPKNHPMYGVRGEESPNFGRVVSPETRKKISLSNIGKKRDVPKETQERLVLIRRELSLGENNPQWKGGISFEPYCPKFNNEFKERVRAFFGYYCIECGSMQNGTKLHVHHINFNKKACCDSSIPLFVPLCHSCHGKTQKNRPYWVQHFTDLINQYYGGKCYLSKDEMGSLQIQKDIL